MMINSGVKEIERPNVECAASQVHAGRSFGFDAHICPCEASSITLQSRVSVPEARGKLKAVRPEDSDRYTPLPGGGLL